MQIAALIWLNYCRYGEKPYPIDHDMQIWALLTRNQCSVCDTEMTIIACCILVYISMLNFKQFGLVFLFLFFYNLFSDCVVQSWKDLSMWLKYFRAFLITNCPLSVVVVVVVVGVVVDVNFSHFHLLLQNHRTNFSQTWRKASFGEGEMKGPPFSKGR